MITNYIAGADAVLLCYDITNYESFANLEDWYRLVIRTFSQTKLPYVALVGNKSKYFPHYGAFKRALRLDWSPDLDILYANKKICIRIICVLALSVHFVLTLHTLVHIHVMSLPSSYPSPPLLLLLLLLPIFPISSSSPLSR